MRRWSILCMFTTTELRSSTWVASTCLWLKARSWRVKAAARWAVLRMSSSSWLSLWLRPSRWTMSSQRPVMTVRRLLKSWATPPASRPTASIFCDWRSSSFIRFSLVTSRITPT